MLDRTKQFTLKNGEFPGDTLAYQSGYPGGAPAKINTAGSIARAYDDIGYVGIFAKGSDVNVSGDAVTFYAGPGIFTLSKGTAEATYPYLSTATYAISDAVGIVASGQFSNSYSTNLLRGRVLAVGAVAGGITSSLTVLFVGN
jgi:hypothetical protein